MDRTITSNSVTLKNTQTEPQKYYFSTKQIIFRVAGLNKKIILDFFYLPDNYSRRVCKSNNKKSLALVHWNVSLHHTMFIFTLSCERRCWRPGGRSRRLPLEHNSKKRWKIVLWRGYHQRLDSSDSSTVCSWRSQANVRKMLFVVDKDLIASFLSM